MSIHEYIFVTVSIIYGLAVTRLLSKIFDALRSSGSSYASVYDYVWATAVAIALVWFIWIGFALQSVESVGYGMFSFLLLTATTLYGAVEFSFPSPPSDGAPVSRTRELRLSALFVLAYLISVAFAHTVVAGSEWNETLRLVVFGWILAAAIAVRPSWFRLLAPLFFIYAIVLQSPLQMHIGLSP